MTFTGPRRPPSSWCTAAAAGTYTLPLALDTLTGQTLQFPFGVADLARADGGQAFDANRFDTNLEVRLITARVPAFVR